MTQTVTAFEDFRDFLAALRAQGELIEVDRPVAPELEVAKALRKSAAVGGPAVVFKKNGTDFPLVGGVYNSRSKALIAFGCTEDNVMPAHPGRVGETHPASDCRQGPSARKHHRRRRRDRPVRPCRYPEYSPDDGGPYITCGIVVSHDPETGIPDLGHYRFEIIDKKKLSFLALPNHRFAKNLAKACPTGTRHSAPRW